MTKELYALMQIYKYTLHETVKMIFVTNSISYRTKPAKKERNINQNFEWKRGLVPKPRLFRVFTILYKVLKINSKSDWEGSRGRRINSQYHSNKPSTKRPIKNDKNK